MQWPREQFSIVSEKPNLEWNENETNKNTQKYKLCTFQEWCLSSWPSRASHWQQFTDCVCLSLSLSFSPSVCVSLCLLLPLYIVLLYYIWLFFGCLCWIGVQFKMLFRNFILHLNRIHINRFIEGTVNTHEHVHTYFEKTKQRKRIVSTFLMRFAGSLVLYVSTFFGLCDRTSTYVRVSERASKWLDYYVGVYSVDSKEQVFSWYLHLFALLFAQSSTLDAFTCGYRMLYQNKHYIVWY